MKKAAGTNAIYVMLDLEYETQAPDVRAAFGGEVSIGQIDRNRFSIIPARPAEEVPEGEVILGKTFRAIAEPAYSKTLVYVGACEKYMQTLALNAGPDFTLLHYNPESNSLQEAPSPKRALMQRYALLEKVKSEDTQVLGILIGSVVVEGYLEIISNIKLTAARAGKKTYEVLIGKLNEPKLKNF